MGTNALQLVQSGKRTNAEGHAVRNKLLLSIPRDEFHTLRPRLEFLDLPGHLSLHEPNHRVEYAYFANTGMISLVVVAQDGRTVEVGLVGNEGVAGLSCAVHLKRSPLREIVQIGGDGFRVEVLALQSCLRSAPQFQDLLARYAILAGMQVAQTAACNRLHGVRQRLARWLLMAQDRVCSGKLAITHDFLATMLGTDRPSVSLAAAFLQERKAIRYLRRAVQILSRKKLESCACECYGAIRQFEGELGVGYPNKTVEPL
jgi:CRP-like cAMP-binding protein